MAEELLPATNTVKVWTGYNMGRADRTGRRLSLALLPAAKRVLLLLVVIVLVLEIIGVGAALSGSLGLSGLEAYTGLPGRFSTFITTSTSKLPYLSFAMLVSALLVGVIGQFFAKPGEGNEELSTGQLPHGKSRDDLVLCAALVLAALLVWLPRSLQSLPIGSDTLYYMSVVDTMKKEGPMWAIIYTDKPFLYLMLYALGQLSGLATVDLFRILPVVLAVSTTASVWFFVSAFYKEAAGYASLLTAASTALMRTSIDLYASFFATTLLFLTLGIYFRNLDGNHLRQSIALQLLLVVILMSYWYVWIFLLAVLGLAEILSHDRQRRAKALFQAFLPSIAVMGIFAAVAFANPPPVYWGLGSSFAIYLGRAVTPVGVVTYARTTFNISDLSLLGQDNLVLPILACLALILLGPKSFPLRTIYIWSAVMLAFSLVSTTGTHAALLFPLPTLAGLGLRRVVEQL